MAGKILQRNHASADSSRTTASGKHKDHLRPQADGPRCVRKQRNSRGAAGCQALLHSDTDLKTGSHGPEPGAVSPKRKARPIRRSKAPRTPPTRRVTKPKQPRPQAGSRQPKVKGLFAHKRMVPDVIENKRLPTGIASAKLETGGAVPPTKPALFAAPLPPRAVHAPFAFWSPFRVQDDCF